jgi:hypothetical protein
MGYADQDLARVWLDLAMGYGIPQNYGILHLRQHLLRLVIPYKAYCL